MAKNKKPVEEKEIKTETLETVNETEVADFAEIPNQIELVSEPAQPSMFSYGLLEAMAMEDIDNRIFYIDGVIDENIFHEVNMMIIKANMMDANIPVSKRIPIKLIINSKGGSVIDGLGTIDCIKSSVTPVVGVVTSYAFSMAFNIFVNCHMRVATPNATFLYHEGETAIMNSTGKFKNTARFYDMVDERLDKMISSCTKMTPKELNDIKLVENYWFTDDGVELGFVDAVIGEDVSFEDIFAVHGDYICDCEECQKS